jgi:hypothetical protein
MKEVTELNIPITVTFCYMPVHYVRYYCLTFISKKDNQPVPNLSKECNYPTTVYFRFKFEWIITARYVSINCAIRIKYIVNTTRTYIFGMTFSIIFIVVNILET